ncbi:hypothetical protein ACHAQA_004275 [Verticillium albo-atrum]
MSTPNTIIIGGGVAAIAMAHTLKCKLGHDDFVIYEKRNGPGGTWVANTYPGCGSDVPIHLYSFSFNLNPNWTQALADQEEILECEIFHTAEWNHNFDYAGKRIAVIGNGCSAAQVVPTIASKVKQVTQYARSPQWYHPRPNKLFSSWEKFCFKYVPLWQRWHRLDLFLKTDQLASIYGSDESQVKARLELEEEARQYILSEAPEKYHAFLVPQFPLGCKRRIYDPGYLACLRRDNVQLLPEGIQEFTETGLISERGTEEDFDAVILATGFSVSSFLAPMKIVGRNGKSLHEQWEEHRGAQAYMGTFVHNHPNFAIL